MVAEQLVEERNLLPVAAKNAAGSRRAVRRVITSVEEKKKIEENEHMEQKEKTKGKEQQAAYTRESSVKLEDELQKVCHGILTLMDENLISLASAGESKVFYNKVKGDFYRYLEESATGDAKSKAVEDAGVAKTGATKIAEKDSVVTHSIHSDQHRIYP